MSADIKELVLPERIEPSELVYFKKVADGLERAAQCEVEAQRLLTQATALRGAHESWVTHLVEHYGLDPAHDVINPEDGTIQRGGGNGTAP